MSIIYCHVLNQCSDFLCLWPFCNARICGCTLEGIKYFKTTLNKLIIINTQLLLQHNKHSECLHKHPQLLDNSLTHSVDILGYMLSWSNLSLISEILAFSDSLAARVAQVIQYWQMRFEGPVTKKDNHGKSFAEHYHVYL